MEIVRNCVTLRLSCLCSNKRKLDGNELRPELHPYCARMAGSVIDGEDVVEALVKAIEALPEICSPEWWRRVGPADRLSS